MARGRNGVLSAIERVIEMLVALSSFILAYAIAVNRESDIPVRLGSAKTLLLLFISVILYSLVGEFCRNQTRGSLGILRIFLSSIVYFGISVLSTLIFAREERIIFLLRWTLFAGILTTAFMIAKSLLLYFLSRWGKRSSPKRLVIVGDNSDAFIKEAEREFEIIGSVGKNRGSLGSLDDFENILSFYKPDVAFFEISDISKAEIIRLVNLCDDKCVRCYFLPSFYGYLKSARQVEYLGASVLINVHSTPLDDGFNRAVKRALDILGSIFLIAFTLPLMIFAAIGVRLSSPGPVLFKQTRVGAGGKPFTMLKFRSMRTGGEENSVWSTGIDERKTRFGNFLRKTSIDELPQLFNVLAGSMSLVGPRPEIPHFVEKFREKIPLYMVKHYVKPGITGLAQIRGLRGDTSIKERIDSDIFYIENWSLSLDILVLLKTPFKAINKKEKYVSRKEQDEK